jgi:FKBP-type peptidyl-prolyl cis-trans isomerase FkpA
VGCKKDNTDAQQLATDTTAIEKYLSDHNLTAQKSASGLYYIISTPGTGGHPTSQSTVTVNYKGYLLDGSVFDQTTPGQPRTFGLDGLIQGWQEAIPMLQKGGKGTFFLPSYLGYGPSGKGSIPGNTVLIFDITLVTFQ